MATATDVLVRAQHIAVKVRAGVRRFGLRTTAIGAAHLLWLRIRRPAESHVRVDTGAARPLDFRFGCPRQVMPALVVFRAFTEPEFDLLRRVLQPGSTFFDVGGGIGTYAVTAATLVDGPVHVFEPTSESAAMIRRNALVNRVGDKIEVNQVALSDAVGYSTIVSGHNTFTNNVGTVTEAPAYDDDATVTVTTLDAFCAARGIEHVDMLKVDVAGYEPMVVAGAERMLSEGRVDLVTLELSLRFLDTYRQLLRHGYRFFYCEDGNLLPVSNLDPGTLINERPSVFTVNIVAALETAIPRLQRLGIDCG